MLQFMLERLSVAQAHWLARKLGIYDGLHDWMESFCPCSVTSDAEDIHEKADSRAVLRAVRQA